jgi:hypothetical protein
MNVMFVPAIPISLPHASMTCVSLVQKTMTSSTPAAFNLSCPATKPGTWHVDHVGVKAPVYSEEEEEEEEREVV